MPIAVADRSISRIRLIDDEPAVRSSYRYGVEDLDEDLDASEISGPIHSISSLLSGMSCDFDAVICDYNLRMKKYSSVDGDQVVKALYQANIAAVLCTRFDDHLPWPIRQKRRYIPRVLHPNKLESGALLESLRVCVDEFRGVFLPTRKPFRGLVRVEGGDVSRDRRCVHANLVVPSWDQQLISYVVDESFGVIFERVLESVEAGVETHFFAQLNLGAEAVDDLFIDGVEQTA